MKNYDSIITSHEQLIYKYQHWLSFSPIQSKRGVIKSTILRYYRNSSDQQSFFESIIKLDAELSYLQYPNSIIPTMLISCSNITKDKQFIQVAAALTIYRTQEQQQ